MVGHCHYLTVTSGKLWRFLLELEKTCCLLAAERMLVGMQKKKIEFKDSKYLGSMFLCLLYNVGHHVVIT